MSDVSESLASGSPWQGPLQTGVDTISLLQKVVFTRYARLVLPIDGFVFWVKADLLRPSALFNVATLNSAAFGRSTGIETPAPTLIAEGSLHYGTDTNQTETANYSSNSVIFTSEQEINDLNAVTPNMMWVAEHRGVRFAFSSRRPFYRQAGLWHYRGNALYSVTQNQLIDKLDGFDVFEPVVSNSLPIWLSLIAPVYSSPDLAGIGLNGIGAMLYPSFAVPDNLAPPFVSVHIDPNGTRALQPIPHYDAEGNPWQLVADRVRLTLYGFRNTQAVAFLNYVERYITVTENMGMLSGPTLGTAVRDDKHPQPELLILAQKKTIDFEVSYYQTAALKIARQFILEAIVTFIPQDVVPTPPPPVVVVGVWNRSVWDSGVVWG